MVDLTCRELIEFLGEYFEGGLPSENRAVFEAHIGICPPCKAYLENYRDTVDLVSGACEDLEASVPEEVPEALVQAILKARKAASRP